MGGSKNPQPGDRVVFNDRCMWPERVGAAGVIVAPPDARTYPSPLGKAMVLVLLDDDPLLCRKDHDHRDFFCAGGRDGWSCVTSVEALDAQGAS